MNEDAKIKLDTCNGGCGFRRAYYNWEHNGQMESLTLDGPSVDFRESIVYSVVKDKKK